MYYRRDGTPIWYGPGEENAHKATFEWARLFENFADRVVANTVLPNGIRVSTVWLGLDHGWGEGKPEIFESMAFSASVNVHKASEGSIFTYDLEYHEELGCERYATEAEAAVGHVMMCLRFYPNMDMLLPEVTGHGLETQTSTQSL